MFFSRVYTACCMDASVGICVFPLLRQKRNSVLTQLASLCRGRLGTEPHFSLACLFITGTNAAPLAQVSLFLVSMVHGLFLLPVVLMRCPLLPTSYFFLCRSPCSRTTRWRLDLLGSQRPFPLNPYLYLIQDTSLRYGGIFHTFWCTMAGYTSVSTSSSSCSSGYRSRCCMGHGVLVLYTLLL